MVKDADRWGDSYLLAQTLQEMALEQSVDLLLQKVVLRAMQFELLAWFQIWLIDKGDRCAECPFRATCGDKGNCLHLVAGGGKSLSASGVEVQSLDSTAFRLPLGVGMLGKAVKTGKQSFCDHPDVKTLDLMGAPELMRQQPRGCIVTPVRFKGGTFGATVGFSLVGLIEEGQMWSWIFADHIGAAVANARAFEDIRRLKAQLELHNAYLQEEVVEAKAFGDLVGQSSALRQLVSQIDLVAPTEASVLILGETGTGKELVAHEIHCRSLRKNGPLIRVNCASIPKDLFESEFFGHVKGAFTGAVKDRPGRFETAEGGTLFLDEVGEVPMEMQGKLLRVLQEKRYEHVGEDRTREANVRIIAATNKDLKKMVAAGRFREDLFYRLHVFPITVAPLRERRDDIPHLARHFVDLSVKELRCARPRLTKAALDVLQNYDWPGNVRELRNVIERAVILARGGTLHFDLQTAGLASPVPTVGTGSDPQGVLLTETELRRREYANMLAVLEKTGWKIKGRDGAAARLGLNPTTLLSRIKRSGLRKPGV
jgi:transcriptional regulator with GAF, ATPase, and Fis domain